MDDKDPSIQEILDRDKTPECRAIRFIKNNASQFIDRKNWYEVLKYKVYGPVEQENFRYIRFYLYERHRQPKYPTYPSSRFPNKKSYEAYCRYLTYITSLEDIKQQKKEKCYRQMYELIVSRQYITVRPCGARASETRPFIRKTCTPIQVPDSQNKEKMQPCEAFAKIRNLIQTNEME